jgi:multiple sugar transport system permease protein
MESETVASPEIALNETRPSASHRRLTLRQREAIACALFIAPAVLGFLFFTLTPLGVSAYLSFTDYNLANQPSLVGLQNYRVMFTDELWWQSVAVTLKYALAVVPLWILTSLGLALIMNQTLPGIRVYRTIYYLPAVLSGVAVSMLWIWLLNAQTGIVNQALKLIGLKGPNWLGDPQWALRSIIIMSIWSVGWYLPIWLSGLQSIPTELYEAATMDGGNAWTRLRHVTLPLLSPVILYNLVMNLIWATQLFTEPLMMTGGGPRNATLTYMLYTYRNAFQYNKMGLASAMAWVLFVAVLIFTFIAFKSSPMWVYYEGERKR